MENLELKIYPDLNLDQICESVVTENIGKEDEIVLAFDPEVQEVCRQLERYLYIYNARGLAAPQLGIQKRIFSLLVDGEAVTFINPTIVEFGGNTFHTQEQCLSIPGITASLNCRHELIHILGRTLDNRRIERHFRDDDAMAFQHELDHLNGITLFTRMGHAQRQLKRNSYMKKLKKYFKAVKHDSKS